MICLGRYSIDYGRTWKHSFLSEWMFYICQLDTGWLCCWVLYSCSFLSGNSCQIPRVEWIRNSNSNYGYIYLFLASLVLAFCIFKVCGLVCTHLELLYLPWIDPFIIMWCFYLSPVIFFALKLTLCDFSIANTFKKQINVYML